MCNTVLFLNVHFCHSCWDCIVDGCRLGCFLSCLESSFVLSRQKTWSCPSPLNWFRKNMALEPGCRDRGLELPYQVWLAFREWSFSVWWDLPLLSTFFLFHSTSYKTSPLGFHVYTQYPHIISTHAISDSDEWCSYLAAADVSLTSACHDNRFARTLKPGVTYTYIIHHGEQDILFIFSPKVT